MLFGYRFACRLLPPVILRPALINKGFFGSESSLKIFSLLIGFPGSSDRPIRRIIVDLVLFYYFAISGSLRKCGISIWNCPSKLGSDDPVGLFFAQPSSAMVDRNFFEASAHVFFFAILLLNIAKIKQDPETSDR